MTKLARFLDAWLAVRQLVQAANFNRFQAAGLSATQFMTLNVIPSDGGVTVTALAARLNLAPATVAKTVDSLEARGLVTRTRSAVDRRHVLLALTCDGVALHNAASSEFHANMARLFNRLSPAQRDGLIEGLEGLVRADAGAGAVRGDAAPAARSVLRSRPAKS